jgi:TRAP-type C4-dicarboxylate transport system permease small subunit
MLSQREHPDTVVSLGAATTGVDDAGARRVAAQARALPAAWRRADRMLVRATEAGLFAIGALFTLMITLEVISRYVFSFSIYFVNAAARFLLVWFFLLGAGIALRHGAHVGFELLLSAMTPRRRKAVVLFGLALTVVFCLEMVWAGFHSLGPAMNQTEAGLDIPLAWAVLAIPLGFALLLYHASVLLWIELYREHPEGTRS